jgi:flagellar basal-body rod protein FlgF/flagellar basal-body rod protein FlgG
MENSLLIGLSRQMALQRELEVVANNIANINTTGFKTENSKFEEYLMPVARENRFEAPDRRVSFVVDRGTWHNMRAGNVETTNNPLDITIDGNAFLVVQTPAGERYTRNGSLQTNAQGQLVMADGSPVLGDNGPIVLQQLDRQVSIAPDGRVTVIEGNNNRTESLRGRLRLVTFANPQRLQKEGANKFTAPAGVAAVPATNFRIIQGAVEKSNVNGVYEMTRMIDITRTYTQVSTMLQQQGDLRRSAIEKLAEVPA